MRKNILYAGIVLFVLGIAAGLLSIQSVTASQISTSPLVKELIIGPKAVGYIPVPLTQAGVVLFSYNSSSAVDFYLVNAEVFNGLQTGAQPRNTIISMEGSGVYEVYENSSSGVFPYSGFVNQSFPTPAYLINFSQAMPADTYYGIFSNYGTDNATVYAKYLPESTATLNSGSLAIGAYGAIAFVLLLGGVLLSLFSLFLPAKEVANNSEMDDDVKKAYAKLKK